MRLTIFGATGGVGRQLVTQALDEGHEVTAFARDGQRVGLRHPNLEVVEGNVLDPGPVRRAVAGRDAVLCALGRPLMNRERLRENGTRAIATAMAELGVRRLVCLSGLGAGDSRKILPARYRYLIVPLILRRVIADHDAQERLVRDSGLDWVLVRPGNLTDGARTGCYRSGFTAIDRSLTLKVSRADVAEFMLKQLDGDTWLHEAPALSC